MILTNKKNKKTEKAVVLRSTSLLLVCLSVKVAYNGLIFTFKKEVFTIYQRLFCKYISRLKIVKDRLIKEDNNIICHLKEKKKFLFFFFIEVSLIYFIY